MSEPVIADRKPCVLDLSPATTSGAPVVALPVNRFVTVPMPAPISLRLNSQWTASVRWLFVLANIQSMHLSATACILKSRGLSLVTACLC